MTLPARKSPSERFEIESAPGLVDAAEADTNIVSATYFDTMRIPLIEGRGFTATDGALAPRVVLINDVLARRSFGPGAAGRRMREPDGTSVEIVGVVASGKYRMFQDGPEPTVYFPLSQRRMPVMHMIVRTAGMPPRRSSPLRDQLLSAGSGASVEWTMTFEQYLAHALIIDRVLTTVVGACAVLALLLAMLGVHGVMADAVRRRTPEIGLAVRAGRTTTFGGRARVRTWDVSHRGRRRHRNGGRSVAPVDRPLVPPRPAIARHGGARDRAALDDARGGRRSLCLPAWRALRISPTVALRAE